MAAAETSSRRWLAVVAMLVVPLLAPTPFTVTAVTLAVLVALVAFEAVTCGPMEHAEPKKLVEQ